MAVNIHTDSRFERVLAWLSRKANKTKTDLLKELVMERYHLKKASFQFGAFKPARKKSSRSIQSTLKSLDHDLD